MKIKRIYEAVMCEHHNQNRQMVFLVGPRQVGKTTTCRSIHPNAMYYNWDNQNHRNIIVKGPEAVAVDMKLDHISRNKKYVIFDKIHKYSKWKQFLKGFFDVYGDRVYSNVTGSSRLDIYKVGGDSLMGRYFL